MEIPCPCIDEKIWNRHDGSVVGYGMDRCYHCGYRVSVTFPDDLEMDAALAYGRASADRTHQLAQHTPDHAASA